MEMQRAALLLLDDGDIVEFFEFTHATPESVPMLQGRFTVSHIRPVGQRDHAISADCLAGLTYPLLSRHPRYRFVTFLVLRFTVLGLLIAGVCRAYEVFFTADSHFHLAVGKNDLTGYVAVIPCIFDAVAVPAGRFLLRFV